MNKKEYYNYIDKNGIPISEKSGISFTTDELLSGKIDTRPKRFVELALPFQLDQDEQLQLVVDYIYDLTNIRISSLEELIAKKSLNGLPFILELNEHEDQKKLMVAFRMISGSVIIRGDQKWKDNGHEIRSLGNIEEIKGDLGLSNTEIEDLGKLKLIHGDFWFSGNDEFRKSGFKIKSLYPLEEVKGNVSLRGNSIETLSTLKTIGGNLSLRYSMLKDLGSLEFVGGNVTISKYHPELLDFSSINIKGTIRAYNDKPL